MKLGVRSSISGKLPKLFLFDLDGTLVECHWDHVLNEAERIFGELGVTCPGRSEMFDDFLNVRFFQFLAEDNREELIRHYWQKFDWVNVPAPKPFDGVVDTLARIRKSSASCAIVTARSLAGRSWTDYLADTGFLTHVQAIVNRDENHHKWHDKEDMILKACRDFGVGAEEAVMVGDTPGDIISARRVKLGATVAVRSGRVVEKVLRECEPDYILDSVCDLPSVFPLL